MCVCNCAVNLYKMQRTCDNNKALKFFSVTLNKNVYILLYVIVVMRIIIEEKRHTGNEVKLTTINILFILVFIYDVLLKQLFIYICT